MRPDYPSDGPETSAVAALENRARRPRQVDRIRAVIEARGGATCAEVEVALGFPAIPRHVVSRRLTDLRDAGAIVDSGIRRRTPEGVRAIVWEIPPAA